MKPYKKIMNILGWLLLCITFVYIIFQWNSLPDQIPAHYDVYGKVDRYGGKANILLMPIVMGIIFLMLVLLERYPNVWNVPVEVREETKERIYDSMAAVIVTLRCMLMLSALYTTICESQGIPLSAWYLPVFLTAVLSVIIIDIVYIVKVNKKESEAG